MKIAVTAQGEDLNSEVDPRFGRAKYFIVVEPDSGEFAAHSNELNLNAVFRLCRAAGKVMLAQGYGKIVNVASLMSFQGGITIPAYTASKHGVAGLTKSFANEWAGRNITVNAVAPGYVLTEVTAPLQKDRVRNRQILERIPQGRWAEPEDMVGAVIFLASDASRYVQGHVLVVDGGWLSR